MRTAYRTKSARHLPVPLSPSGRGPPLSPDCAPACPLSPPPPAAELPTAAFKNEGGPDFLSGPTFSVGADSGVTSMGWNHNGGYAVVLGGDNATVLRGEYSSWEVSKIEQGQEGGTYCRGSEARSCTRADSRVHCYSMPLLRALKDASPSCPPQCLDDGHYTALLTQTTVDEDGNGEPHGMGDSNRTCRQPAHAGRDAQSTECGRAAFHAFSACLS